MSEVEKPANGIDALTARINAKYREVESLARSTVEAGIELGGMLTEKKEALGHGEWLPWLRENFEGSERHAQRFMKLHGQRDQLLSGDPTRVSDMSLREAFKEVSAPKATRALPAPEKDKQLSFEDMVGLTKFLANVRDRELFREKDHETFGAYLKAEFPEQDERLEEAVRGWELVVDNPPPELRGAKADKALELTERLVELSKVPQRGSGLVVAGRQVREIEERELYKMIGDPTFSLFCRERLGLSRKSQSVLSIAVELADIDPFFDMDNFDLDMPIPENVMDLDWERAMPLLEEFAELTETEADAAHD